ncbi:MAG: hypothetical protein AB1744_08860, partial [Candidatus Zixiibacteriota bacterium]
RLVTEEFVLVADWQALAAQRCFLSLAALHAFLNDSVSLGIEKLCRLDRRKSYVLELDISCISLTDINLAVDGPSRDQSGSPVKYLFRQFLKLTGYGREDLSVKSRPFSLSELDSR